MIAPGTLMDGLLVGFALLGIQYVARVLHRFVLNWKLKMVFGKTINEDSGVKIVYAELELDPEIIQLTGPSVYSYVKPQGKSWDQDQSRFSILRPVSSAEVRAIAYLSKLISTKTRGTQDIVPDSDYESDWPSTISVGGPRSNSTTRTILNLPNNDIVEMDANAIYAKNGLPLAVRGGQFDHGIIARFSQRDSGDRVLIACAGIGEYGTSGASWYLANKWRSLLNKPGKRWVLSLLGSGGDFVAVIRVDRAKDSSAQLESLFISADSANKKAKDLNLRIPPTSTQADLNPSGSTVESRYSAGPTDNSANEAE